MADKEQALKTIYSAIDKYNQNASPELKLEKSSSTVLTGPMGKLDSLGIINFIVILEQKIADDFEAILTLTNENTFTDGNNVFATGQSLADYIAELLKKEGK